MTMAPSGNDWLARIAGTTGVKFWIGDVVIYEGRRGMVLQIITHPEINIFVDGTGHVRTSITEDVRYFVTMYDTASVFQATAEELDWAE
jgi:hypothetical protein